MPLTEKEREELDARARRGETVIPGGKGGKSLEAQESLAQARMRGGRTRKEQLGVEGFRELGRSGGRSGGGRTKGYRDLGPYGGLSKGSKSRHGSTSFPGVAVAATDESNILHASRSFAPPNDTNYLQYSSTQVLPSASFAQKDDSQSSKDVVNEN